MSNSNILEIAKKQGYATAIILVITLVIQGYLQIKFPTKTLELTIVTSIGMIVLLYTYRLMLLGILYIAEESKDQFFILSTRSFIKANIISCVVIAIMMVVSELIQTDLVQLLTFISIFGSFIYLGIVSLKIAKGFMSIAEKYGKTARRAAFWKKVSGYLMASVILSFIGIITSLVADYFMWRIISIRLEEFKTSN